MELGAFVVPMFCTISRPLTLQRTPLALNRQVWTRLLQVPVRSAHGPAAAATTVTVNVQLLAPLAVSSPAQVTGVSPMSKVEPEGGEQFIEATPQLSLMCGVR